MGETWRTHGKIWSVNLKKKRSHERLRCRWADNMKMHLREIGYGGRNWIKQAQNRNCRELT
jgi:hypothetical protein